MEEAHFRQFVRLPLEERPTHDVMDWIASLTKNNRRRAETMVDLFDDNDAQPTAVVYEWLFEINAPLGVLQDIAANVSNKSGGHFYANEDTDIELNQMGNLNITREMDDNDYLSTHAKDAEDAFRDEFPNETPAQVIQWLAKIEWYDVASEEHIEKLKKAAISNT